MIDTKNAKPYYLCTTTIVSLPKRELVLRLPFIFLERVSNAESQNL